MAERDEKGRFVKGNKVGISTDVARERQLASAQSRAENRRKRKSLAEVLRAELDTPAGESGMTKQEAIVAKIIKGMYDRPSAKDLKIIAEVLGEIETNVKLDAPDDKGLLIKFGTGSE